MKTELGDRGQRLLEALQALAEPEAEFETREEAGRILLKLLPPLVGAHLNDKLSAENAGRLFDDVVGHVSEAACRRRLPGSLAAFRGTTPGEAVTWIRIIAYRRAVDLLDNEKREQPCDPGELPAERGGRFAAERDLQDLERIITKVILALPKARRPRVRLFIEYRLGSFSGSEQIKGAGENERVPGKTVGGVYQARRRARTDIREVLCKLRPPLIAEEMAILARLLGVSDLEVEVGPDSEEES